MMTTWNWFEFCTWNTQFYSCAGVKRSDIGHDASRQDWSLVPGSYTPCTVPACLVMQESGEI